jgi:2-oxoglutarate ferredoxin oxidoreductase subunit beta
VTLALAAKATFVARALAIDAKGLTDVLRAAAAHQGTSCVEIFQNCNVFNDGAFDAFAERAVRSERCLLLEDGAPLIFGKEQRKGIVLDGFQPQIIEIHGPEDEARVLRYDRKNKILANILASLPFPEFPVPLGVFYEESRPVYEEELHKQIASATERQGLGDLQKLLESGDSWVVEP